jgi:hypothetical protein
MRQHVRVFRLLAALCVPLLLVVGGGALSAPRLASQLNCTDLPFVVVPGAEAAAQPGLRAATNCPSLPGQGPAAPATATATATATSTRTATATATTTQTAMATSATTPTATSTATATTVAEAQLSGTVQLLPESASVAEERRVPRYLVVLDASGSMSASFNGQCNNTGQTLQCANGPPDAPAIQVTGTGPTYYWITQNERRIYVAKKAVERLIGLANMPGNAGYDLSRPDEPMAVVWFRDYVTSSNAMAFSSNASQVINFVTNANKTNGNSYLSQGGTNGAAGLYRAARMLEAAPRTVDFGGKTYTYENHVVFITDGVTNRFLDVNAADLDGGASNNSTYPTGSSCYNLRELVLENAACQTTDIGGTYHGWDRPISQMVNVSRNYLRGLYGPTRVYAIALSNIPSTGIKDGVASSSSTFFSAESLVKYPDGSTNVDQIMDEINTRIEQDNCRPSTVGGWTDVIDAAHMPEGAPTLGEVLLTSAATGASYTASIVRDSATGALGYSLDAPPAGDYQLRAQLFYKGDDGATRSYSELLYAETAVSSIAVNITGQPQAIDQLSLRLGGDVCATP